MFPSPSLDSVFKIQTQRLQRNSLYRAVSSANLGFSCSVSHLGGPRRKHIFTCRRSKGHGLWFVFGGFRSVLFVSCFKVCYFDRPISVNNRLFLIFLILVTCKNIATPASFLRQKNPLTIAISFAILEQWCLDSFSAKLGQYVTLWIGLNPLHFTPPPPPFH